MDRISSPVPASEKAAAKLSSLIATDIPYNLAAKASPMRSAAALVRADTKVSASSDAVFDPRMVQQNRHLSSLQSLLPRPHPNKRAE